MKYLKVLTILCLIILTSSCENGSNNENGVNYLSGSKWILTGFLPHDTQIEELKPENLREMTLEFLDENTVHAKSSCNTFDGYYAVTGPDLIMIDSLYTTLINCENDTVRDWEERYYKELKNALNYQITGNRLIIETKSNVDILFKAD